LCFSQLQRQFRPNLHHLSPPNGFSKSNPTLSSIVASNKGDETSVCKQERKRQEEQQQMRTDIEKEMPPVF
jgi:hypothetical protein